jgi:hypothetical protein
MRGTFMLFIRKNHNIYQILTEKIPDLYILSLNFSE